MKKFALFAIVATLTAALVHLITTWVFGVETPGTVGLLIPIAFVFVLFYVRGSDAKPQ
ncbi:MAG: hypothetical protein VYE77_10845 [Planctomycetota bacterium]|nr:hypothetical protein [Planctomycetota bacterium]